MTLTHHMAVDRPTAAAKNSPEARVTRGGHLLAASCTPQQVRQQKRGWDMEQSMRMRTLLMVGMNVVDNPPPPKKTSVKSLAWPTPNFRHDGQQQVPPPPSSTHSYILILSHPCVITPRNIMSPLKVT